MKKRVKEIKLVEATKSRVNAEFIFKSTLPESTAIHVAALLAGVSDRTARKQFNKFKKAGLPA